MTARSRACLPPDVSKYCSFRNLAEKLRMQMLPAHDRQGPQGFNVAQTLFGEATKSSFPAVLLQAKSSQKIRQLWKASALQGNPPVDIREAYGRHKPSMDWTTSQCTQLTPQDSTLVTSPKLWSSHCVAIKLMHRRRETSCKNLRAEEKLAFTQRVRGSKLCKLRTK